MLRLFLIFMDQKSLSISTKFIWRVICHMYHELGSIYRHESLFVRIVAGTELQSLEGRI